MSTDKRTTTLQTRLKAEPSTGAWNRIVAALEAFLDDEKDLKSAVAAARKALSAWPADIERPVPFFWILRAMSPEGFAPVSLANAICLGDRWATEEVVDLETFVEYGCPSDEQLERLRRNPDLRGIRRVDAACTSANNPLSPGTLIAETGTATYLADSVLSGAEVFDVAQTYIGVEGVAVLLKHCRSLRALTCGDDHFADIQDLLKLDGLEQLTTLELDAVFLEEEEVRAIIACPRLAGLRELRLPDPLARLLPDLKPAALRDLLNASPLSEEAKATVLKGPRQERFLGIAGAPFDGEHDDPDEQDDE